MLTITNPPPSSCHPRKGIDIDIPRGSFVVVCGRVGSGKSSLIQALLGEMKLSRGSAYLGGSVSYFPQAPWIQNATLRDNIIFGDLEPDEKRLRVAVTSCALDPDVAMREALVAAETSPLRSRC